MRTISDYIDPNDNTFSYLVMMLWVRFAGMASSHILDIVLAEVPAMKINRVSVF